VKKKYSLMTWELFNQLVFAWIGIGLAVYVLLLFISAPYGRHTRKGWGPVIPNKLAWVLHYTNRAFVFPFRTRTKGKTMPLLIALFAVFFNLVPRAIDHHKWYKKEFADYPKERKAVIPFIL